MRAFFKTVSLWAFCTSFSLCAQTYTCQAPTITAPCAQHTNTLPYLGWGNPVHIQTADKWQHEVDLPMHPQWPGLGRYYLSQARTLNPSLQSHYWSLSYDVQLQAHGQSWLLRQADGSTAWLAAHELTEWPSTDVRWRWQTPQGAQLDFNQDGWLIYLSQQHHPTIAIQRHSQAPLQHAIQSIRYLGSKVGLSLHYDTPQRRLTGITSPLGSFSYHYDKLGRLQSVERPDSMQKEYTYAPTAEAGHDAALSHIHLRQHHLRLPLYEWRYQQGKVIGGRAGTQLQFWQLDKQAKLSTVSQAAQQQTWRFTELGKPYQYTLQSCAHCPIHQSTQTYDSAGHLTQAQGWQLQRSTDGRLQRASTERSGWGALQLHFTPQGQLSSWQYPLGQHQRRYDSQGRLLEQRNASQSWLKIRYPAPGLTTLDYAHDAQSLQVKLRWLGTHLVTIEHPEETQQLWLNHSGKNIHKRRVERSRHALLYEEHFHYDAQQRLLEHVLPEGGSLRYTWGKHEQLLAIHWIDKTGQQHPILQSSPTQAGYQWGNGIAAVTQLNHQAQATRHSIYDVEHPLWEQERQYGGHGQVVRERLWHENHSPQETHYAYDEDLRLIVEKTSLQEHWWQWHSTGKSKARHIPAVAQGELPAQLGPWRLEYGAQQRLQSIWAHDLALAHYRHDAFGQRIYKHSQQAQTGYLYHDHQVVAEYSLLNVQAEQLILQRRYIYAHHVPVGMLLYDAQGAAQIYFIHSDLMGAPRLVTDAQARTVWLAHYSAWGRAKVLLNAVDLPLRLPGQYFDAESTWHDNLLRTYLPDHGHYLETDPLGPLPLPGSQAYGYAQQQPLRYIDPLGLILFAFDGTRMGASTSSNVWKLAQLYADGPTHYQRGPGNSYYLEWDAIVAWNARQILENHWQSLLNAVERQKDNKAALHIDILGYSRGAALAREFANRVLEHTQAGLFEFHHPQRGWLRTCVDLRFMGLFDTVAQFGLHGSHNHLYRLGVANAWHWVAHAVALHEHRHLFPLSAINAAHNTVQAPFIGAHGDIGGGTLNDELVVSDLDKVALAWMHWQATAAGLSLHALPEPEQAIKQPILRDARPAFLRYLQNGDRQVLYHGQGQDLSYQDQHPQLGRKSREQVEPIIQRYLDWRTRSDSRVGEIDMPAYSRWLEETHGWAP